MRNLQMKQLARVPTPWKQVSLTVLPGFALLLFNPFSVPSLSKALTYLGLVVTIVVTIQTVVQIILRRALFPLPVWVLIPLGWFTGLGSISTLASLGFLPAVLLLLLLGLAFARQNGASAGLFVLAGAMTAAGWAIERGISSGSRPFSGIVLNSSVILTVMILTPILVLRARSILSQVVALLFPVIAYSINFAVVPSGIFELSIPAMLCLLFAPSMALTARGPSARAWIYVGLAVLTSLLVVPISVLVEYHRNLPVTLPQPVEGVLALTIFLMPSAALVIAALLLYSGVTHLLEWQNANHGNDGNTLSQQRDFGTTPLVTLMLSASLLAVTLYNLYWLMIWDSTYDPLDGLWLILPILTALFGGAVLAIALPRSLKLAGLLYALLLPVLMIAVFVSAKSVDFRRLTQERAGQVSQALQTYYMRAGHYPQNLRQLTPWYAFSLPEPIIIQGQEWCYAGGDDYYRLGYVDREHWSSPIWIGRTYKAVGPVSDLPPICVAEIAGEKNR